MMPSALIFDVDGTLADTEELHRQAFNGAFARHGFNWRWNRDDYRRLLKITGGKERIGHFIRSLRLDSRRESQCLAQVAVIHQTKTALYTHNAASGRLQLRSGVARLIRDATLQGVRLALATTTSAANVQALLTSTLGEVALRQFDVVAAGDMVANKKPAPDAYLHVLERLQLAPEHCVAFEDSRNGLCAATAAGIPTVVTPCQWTADEDFSTAWLILPELGDPGRPLPKAAATRLRQRWLCLDDLREAREHAA